MNVEERLIVAADFDPNDSPETQATNLAERLEGTGVYLKFNSLLRAHGYASIGRVHDFGIKYFADLKLNDIPKTMEYDALFLAGWKPELLTVMCSAGVAGMKAVQEALPETEVLGVTVLTSLDKDTCRLIYGGDPSEIVQAFCAMAFNARLRGLILSPHELCLVKGFASDKFTLNTPGIRPEWSMVEGDDQSRIMTPKQAIQAGADRIVVGRPITRAKNPLDAVKRTLEEIEKGLEAREQ